MEHGTQGVPYASCSCLGKGSGTWASRRHHSRRRSGPFNVFENGSPLDFLLGCKWSRKRGRGWTLSFTLFKCQITFVQNGTARHMLLVLPAWRILVRSIVPSVASFAWLIAERRPLAPLVTCHVSWIMLMATHCWRPVTPSPLPLLLLGMGSFCGHVCIDFCAKLMLTFIINLQIENEHLH